MPGNNPYLYLSLTVQNWIWYGWLFDILQTNLLPVKVSFWSPLKNPWRWAWYQTSMVGKTYTVCFNF